MNLDLQIKYSTSQFSWLCFQHAVLEAQKGKEIKTEINNFNSDYYMGNTICEICFPAYSLNKKE